VSHNGRAFGPMHAGERRSAPVDPAASSARPRGLVWDWSAAAPAAVYALPAAAVSTIDVSLGLALAVGVLPASIAGVAPTRRGRRAVVLLGLLVGVPMFLGGLLSGVPVLAVAAIAVLGPATALLATRARLGLLAMNLSLPLVGIGLSYADAGEAAALAALMVAGSVFAFAVSLLWPERAPQARRAAPVLPTLDYGICLGAAGATAAAIGFAADLDHVGWATGAALLVMRPVADMQRIRSVGRVLAVIAGALAGIALVRLDPPGVVYGAAAVVALAGVGGTHRSRWYVTAAFTTFLVFLLLLHADVEDAAHRFGERVGETLLGVGLAYLFGLALPALVRRRRAPDAPP